MAGPDDVDSKITQEKDAALSLAAEALEESGQIHKKKAEIDVQALDDRLRRAVLDGDVTYVQSRLGDRKLSEAEAVLLIRAKQEAAENASQILATQETLKLTEEEKQEEIDAWKSFFANGLRQQAANTSRTANSDAPVYDANGYRYYANFGYDAQGNYRTSFGGVVENGVHKDENGETDLRYGIHTLGKTFYNIDTKEALVYIEAEGTYTRVRREGDKNVILETDISEAAALQEKAGWPEKNRRRTDAEIAAEVEQYRGEDIAREAMVRGTSQPRGAQHTTTSSSGHSTGSGGNTTGTSHTTNTVPAGGTAGAVGRMVAGMQKDVRDQRLQAQLLRQTNLRERDDMNRRNNRDGGKSGAPGGSSFVDNKGLVTVKDGFVDNRDGFHAKDGSYMDFKGNFVDKEGNLWLAGDKSGKPIPKQEGVDFKALLVARADSPQSAKQYMDADPARRDQLKEITAALNVIDEDRNRRTNVGTVGNYTYSIRGNHIDKNGDLWIGGELKPHAKAEGVDYTDLLMKLQQGKIDDWKATGNLTRQEIADIKDALKANDANLEARGWDISTSRGASSASRFVTPEGQAEQKEREEKAAAQNKPVSLARTQKTAPASP